MFALGLGKGGEMTRSGHDARRPPEATIPAGGGASARQSRASDIEARAAARLIALAVLVRILQSRQFWEGLAVGAIVLAALARMGKENQAGARARLAAWNKRQVQFLERQAERQAGHLQRQAERQGKRLVRKAKGPLAASK
jgi:predicted nucleic acid-binding protein